VRSLQVKFLISLRVIDKPPFKVSETGWGEFAVQIRLQFVAESGEKPLTLTHSIKLHHWGVPLLPAPTPAPAPPKMPAEQDSSVREETVTAGATPVTARTDGDSLTPAPPTAGIEAPEAPAPPSAAQPAPSTEDTTDASQQVEEGQETKPALPAESSIQSLSLPVHSWQYDELVFYDPLPSFYNLMINHPATPLPVKSKRPRSQRAMFEEDGVKKAKVVVKVKADAETPVALSALTPVDAAGSVPPATATASNAGAGDDDQTPIEEQEVVVDVVPTQTVAGVGELSSADIPMEFTQSMEKEEAKRLDEVRIAMIEQMDRWR
jgi:YEATS domain-containing protein 4